MSYLSNEDRETILNVCRQLAGKRKILATCLYGPQVYGYTKQADFIEVLVIVRNFQPRVMVYSKQVNEINAVFLVVDQGIFERDVDQGFLGEFVAEKIMLPYKPILNGKYLATYEVELKKRIIKELLEDIINEYPELSYELLIKPEYFVYETLLRRTRLLPLAAYNILNMMHEDLKEENIQKMMLGYQKALEKLEKTNTITFHNGYIKLNTDFIEKTKSLKHKFIDLFQNIRIAFFTYIFSAFQATINAISKQQEIFTQTYGKTEQELLLTKIENPEKYLFIPTALGLVALSEKITIEDFLRKTIPDMKNIKLEAKELGGILNSVYLLTVKEENSKHERQIVVKKFKDWIGFKWFPLALWTIGTKSFAVLGKTRLQKEYAINKLLNENGFTVPELLYVSPKEHMIFEEYIKGKSLDKIIKRIIESKEETAEELDIIKNVGKKIAFAHRLGITLGDCKPENIIITENGEICFLDLEQASKDGNKAWDIAEFLYYTGHYISPINSEDTIIPIATFFLEGYLEGKGEKETIKKAASPKYTKVFSIFTSPHILLTISNLCKKIGS